MVSVRSLAMIGGTVLVALGAGQYMKSGAEVSAAAMTPPQRTPDSVRPSLRFAAGTPLVGYQIQPVAVTRAETSPETLILPATTPAGDRDCPVTLDLFADADAMLSLSLLAPCHPNEGVVLGHAGLSVTYQTTATGSLFVDIPALDMSGEVTLRFLDATEVSASAEVPELSELRRFALQWVDGDSFSLSTDAPVVTLGTVATALPMYALVATLPSEDTALAIEVPVTTASCGRAALGAAYFSEGGRLSIADLSMAMPECDAAGGFVVLNNPIADMKLATAE